MYVFIICVCIKTYRLAHIYICTDVYIMMNLKRPAEKNDDWPCTRATKGHINMRILHNMISGIPCTLGLGARR